MSYSNQDLTGQKVDSAVAIKMIENLKIKKGKLKFDNCIWAIFDKDKMLKIYSDPAVTQVKFYIGVFPDDSTPDKKDAPVIIMQVTRQSSETLLPTFDYSVGDSLCPPPTDSSCGSIEPAP